MKGVAHARQVLSGVAGLFSVKGPFIPTSARADATASLMAKNTELPKNRMGSPIPCREHERAVRISQTGTEQPLDDKRERARERTRMTD